MATIRICYDTTRIAIDWYAAQYVAKNPAEIETGSVKSLADKINAIYEYPIVTQHSLNNYF
eukprot:SAG22_NODE_1964_length_3239_cov_702.580573_5_plen_60_part_01